MIDLHTANHVFKKGHRIMVQVPEHVVSDHRPEPAEICAKYFRGEGRGFREGYAEDLPVEAISVERRDLGRAVKGFGLNTEARAQNSRRLRRNMRLSHKRAGVLIVCVCTMALIAPSFHAAQQTPLNYAALFEKSEVMIPMRDGVKLHTEIYSRGTRPRRCRC